MIKSYKIGLKFLYSILLIMYGFAYGACPGIATPVGNTIWQILDNIQQSVVGAETPYIIRGSQVITAPGYYVVADGGGTITIMSNNVFLELAGRELIGITATSVNNIIVHGGYVIGSTINFTNCTNVLVSDIYLGFTTGAAFPSAVSYTNCFNTITRCVYGKNVSTLVQIVNGQFFLIEDCAAGCNDISFISGTANNGLIRRCVGMTGPQNANAGITVVSAGDAAGNANIYIEDCVFHGGTTSSNGQTVAISAKSVFLRNCSAFRPGSVNIVEFGFNSFVQNIIVEDCVGVGDVTFRSDGLTTLMQDCVASRARQGFRLDGVGSAAIGCIAAMPTSFAASSGWGYRTTPSGTATIGPADIVNCVTNNLPPTNDFEFVDPILIARGVPAIGTATYWMDVIY